MYKEDKDNVWGQAHLYRKLDEPYTLACLQFIIEFQNKISRI